MGSARAQKEAEAERLRVLMRLPRTITRPRCGSAPRVPTMTKWLSAMEPVGIRASGEQAARLRLYIAPSTPNSVRAAHNLSVVLDRLVGNCPEPELEIIDVFSQPGRALTDGVIVTPTLIGCAGDKRIVLIGNLGDQIQVQRAIRDLPGSGQ